MKSHLSNSLKSVAVAALAVAGTAHAAFLVTVENAGITSAASTTFSKSGVETFDSVVSGNFSTTYGASGIIGTYAGAAILGADQYGGAGGTGKYAAAYSNTGYTLSLSGASGINYFGFYLSALDSGNIVNFFKAGSLVYSFTPTQVLSTLSTLGSGNYFGNPASSFAGQNGAQPYAFLNFYDQGDTFDSIQFSQGLAGAGYESDNHTFGTYLSIGGTPISPVPEPETYALMLAGLGLVAMAARRRKAGATAA
jgi:hypothetical protein